jgi:uncharacterized short protein YbdD (DUF466 family)
MPTLRPGRRANLLVPKGVPRYEQMVERAKTADPADYEMVERGIRVPINWYAP